MTPVQKHLEWLKERHAFLENTDCISEALEVNYIVGLVEELVKEEKETIVQAYLAGECQNSTAENYYKRIKI